MGAGGIPSGGILIQVGKVGSLPRFGAKPNSRMDLYNENGVRTQSRWYDCNGIAFRNRDYTETKYGIHDHFWTAYIETFIDEDGNIAALITRLKKHEPVDYINYPS